VQPGKTARLVLRIGSRVRGLSEVDHLGRDKFPPYRRCNPFSREAGHSALPIKFANLEWDARDFPPAVQRESMKTDLHKQAKAVSTKLERVFGRRTWRKHADPLSELIGTILSQNTSDHNSHMAYASLRARFRTWDQVKRAKVRSIADAIRPGGLADIKAQRIKDILGQIHNERGETDLSFLARWRTKDIKLYLSRFKGVGDKTVACVLLFSLKRPVMPVDTHVLRVSKRLGLVPQKADAGRAEEILEQLVPENRFYQFHLDLIQHGREVCKAQNPRCPICVLLPDCDYGKKALSKSRSARRRKVS
jgi:endonuclease-3